VERRQEELVPLLDPNVEVTWLLIPKATGRQ
jgi:hypothetical protein